MAKFVKAKHASARLGPEALAKLDQTLGKNSKVIFTKYSEQAVQVEELSSLSKINFNDFSPKNVHWIHIEGFDNLALFEEIKSYLKIDYLYLEDVLNTDHYPKMEELDQALFFIVKIFSFIKENSNELRTKHLAIFLGENFVLSAIERESAVFNPIKKRINENLGRIRKMGADYLFYSMIDSVVDSYYYIVERLGGSVELLQSRVTREVSDNILEEINSLKVEFLYIQKAILPVKDYLSTIVRGKIEGLDQKNIKYFEDVHDHLFQLAETVISYRQILSDILNIYSSYVGFRTNKVMTFLTIFSTIFIPPTFIVGVYGMNFKFMPELDLKWSYPIVWLIIITTMISLLIYLKRTYWHKN
ncbi:MAG: magnesium and cobalt transport protein CorA [Bdellovibrionales bacterium RIFOXYD12_FULL_39_22]|nr:MAG: magnesium and cobalt transport protein CorA [Bdellovibrionales bacterium RIFOXYB1_FULL_39_21]OFZ43739.1 MAG: magnesium and cobalt transport protein CorA [Bdellovibrionales bacterium RIFOXYC12_FULL_39_17]OFZ48090.1 MAG: magnesium and cobalt transport protein CorA [Bdellovibrionales bacterium RIFOXYC1_FULL_39_130]OFZ73774.1 MAG: magnesium and cobalt transport protein CorA [Bdellovibrionales bacterium RIFOXYC2_FULL_39_8]OFZ77247.1 MAG: magnesium and cobalt transport protein CorA [Bdellovib